ncbi:Hypothetical predicted protein [Mytilus galloprovincialis]|uniref:Uncharacterized protein n=1 Tax=Mytilus galloprovincialis TaxID=29158 RepID=A0A8B6CK55_MYTGA|nr:Hypothetical predicted protein [Mytilus galloprovincialis]
MPAVQCPIPGYEYVTEDLDAAIVSVLITVHSTTHAPGPVTTSKVKKVKRPAISTAGTTTKVAGRDKVVQLPECCDVQLRKDLTRSAGGSLTNKPVQEVLAAIKKLAVREENTMGHDKSASARLRESVCPAYGHKCGYCNREHHFEKVCRSKEKSKSDTDIHNTDDCEGAFYDSLCSIASDSHRINDRMLAIDHHPYDNLSDT